MLQGKVALVTGGGRGIGRAIALRFAEHGAAVAVAARTTSEIEAVATECRARGALALAIQLDATDEAAWPVVLQQVVERLGALDILVNNAGGGIFKWIEAMSPAEWDAVIAMNLRSVFLGMHFVWPCLTSRGTGRIINISSMAAYGGGPEYAAYSAAKAAVNAVTKTMALELKKAGHVGITCNVICPGPVASRLRSSHFPDEDPESIMQPEEVAKVALFLASEQGSGMSGAALDVRHY